MPGKNWLDEAVNATKNDESKSWLDEAVDATMTTEVKKKSSSVSESNTEEPSSDSKQQKSQSSSVSPEQERRDRLKQEARKSKTANAEWETNTQRVNEIIGDKKQVTKQQALEQTKMRQNTFVMDTQLETEIKSDILAERSKLEAKQEAEPKLRVMKPEYQESVFKGNVDYVKSKGFTDEEIEKNANLWLEKQSSDNAKRDLQETLSSLNKVENVDRLAYMQPAKETFQEQVQFTPQKLIQAKDINFRNKVQPLAFKVAGFEEEDLKVIKNHTQLRERINNFNQRVALDKADLETGRKTESSITQKDLDKYNEDLASLVNAEKELSKVRGNNNALFNDLGAVIEQEHNQKVTQEYFTKPYKNDYMRLKDALGKATYKLDYIENERKKAIEQDKRGEVFLTAEKAQAFLKQKRMAEAEVLALSNAVFLNEDITYRNRPIEKGNDAFINSLADTFKGALAGAQEELGLSPITESKQAQLLVNKLSEAGINVTDEFKGRAKPTFSSQFGETMGMSTVLGAKIYVATQTLNGIGALGEGIVGTKRLYDFYNKSKIFKNVVNGVSNGLAFEIASDKTSFAMGTGEYAAQQLFDAALNKFKPINKLAQIALKTIGGGAGITFEEYAGDFFDEFTKNGFTQETLDNTFGKSKEEKLEKFFLTYAMGAMSGTKEGLNIMIASYFEAKKKNSNAQTVKEMEEGLKAMGYTDEKINEYITTIRKDLVKNERVYPDGKGGILRAVNITTEQEKELRKKLNLKELTEEELNIERDLKSNLTTPATKDAPYQSEEDMDSDLRILKGEEINDAPIGVYGENTKTEEGIVTEVQEIVPSGTQLRVPVTQLTYDEVQEVKGDFDRGKSGAIDVWQNPETNEITVINGNKRVAMAVGSDVNSIDANFIQANSLEEAKAKGDLINAVQGSKDIKTAVELVKQDPTIVDNLDISKESKSKLLGLSNLNDNLLSKLDNSNQNVMAEIGKVESNKQDAYLEFAETNKLNKDEVAQLVKENIAVVDNTNPDIIFSQKEELEIAKFKKDVNTKQVEFSEIFKEEKDKITIMLWESLKPYIRNNAKIYYQDGYYFAGSSELAAENGYAGTIDGKGNVLIFDKTRLNPDTILHELMHDFLLDAININKDEVLITELQRIFDKVKKDTDLVERYSYAFNNLDEFVSEVFGNRGFRQELSYIKDFKLNRTSSIFDSVSKAIKDFLNRQFGFKIDNTVLDNIFNAVEHTVKGKNKGLIGGNNTLLASKIKLKAFNTKNNASVLNTMKATQFGKELLGEITIEEVPEGYTEERAKEVELYSRVKSLSPTVNAIEEKYAKLVDEGVMKVSEASNRMNAEIKENLSTIENEIGASDILKEATKISEALSSDKKTTPPVLRNMANKTFSTLFGVDPIIAKYFLRVLSKTSRTAPNFTDAVNKAIEKLKKFDNFKNLNPSEQADVINRLSSQSQYLEEKNKLKNPKTREQQRLIQNSVSKKIEYLFKNKLNDVPTVKAIEKLAKANGVIEYKKFAQNLYVKLTGLQSTREAKAKKLDKLVDGLLTANPKSIKSAFYTLTDLISGDKANIVLFNNMIQERLRVGKVVGRNSPKLNAQQVTQLVNAFQKANLTNLSGIYDLSIAIDNIISKGERTVTISIIKDLQGKVKKLIKKDTPLKQKELFSRLIAINSNTVLSIIPLRDALIGIEFYLKNDLSVIYSSLKSIENTISKINVLTEKEFKDFKKSINEQLSKPITLEQKQILKKVADLDFNDTNLESELKNIKKSIDNYLSSSGFIPNVKDLEFLANSLEKQQEKFEAEKQEALNEAAWEQFKKANPGTTITKDEYLNSVKPLEDEAKKEEAAQNREDNKDAKRKALEAITKVSVDGILNHIPASNTLSYVLEQFNSLVKMLQEVSLEELTDNELKLINRLHAEITMFGSYSKIGTIAQTLLGVQTAKKIKPIISSSFDRLSISLKGFVNGKITLTNLFDRTFKGESGQTIFAEMYDGLNYGINEAKTEFKKFNKKFQKALEFKMKPKDSYGLGLKAMLLSSPEGITEAEQEQLYQDSIEAVKNDIETLREIVSKKDNLTYLDKANPFRDTAEYRGAKKRLEQYEQSLAEISKYPTYKDLVEAYEKGELFNEIQQVAIKLAMEEFNKQQPDLIASNIIYGENDFIKRNLYTSISYVDVKSVKTLKTDEINTGATNQKGLTTKQSGTVYARVSPKFKPKNKIFDFDFYNVTKARVLENYFDIFTLGERKKLTALLDSKEFESAFGVETELVNVLKTRLIQSINDEIEIQKQGIEIPSTIRRELGMTLPRLKKALINNVTQLGKQTTLLSHTVARFGVVDFITAQKIFTENLFTSEGQAKLELLLSGSDVANRMPLGDQQMEQVIRRIGNNLSDNELMLFLKKAYNSFGYAASVRNAVNIGDIAMEVSDIYTARLTYITAMINVMKEEGYKINSIEDMIDHKTVRNTFIADRLHAKINNESTPAKQGEVFKNTSDKEKKYWRQLVYMFQSHGANANFTASNSAYKLFSSNSSFEDRQVALRNLLGWLSALVMFRVVGGFVMQYYKDFADIAIEGLFDAELPGDEKNKEEKNRVSPERLLDGDYWKSISVNVFGDMLGGKLPSTVRDATVYATNSIIESQRTEREKQEAFKLPYANNPLLLGGFVSLSVDAVSSTYDALNPTIPKNQGMEFIQSKDIFNYLSATGENGFGTNRNVAEIMYISSMLAGKGEAANFFRRMKTVTSKDVNEKNKMRIEPLDFFRNPESLKDRK